MEFLNFYVCVLWTCKQKYIWAINENHIHGASKIGAMPQVESDCMNHLSLIFCFVFVVCCVCCRRRSFTPPLRNKFVVFGDFSKLIVIQNSNETWQMPNFFYRRQFRLAFRRPNSPFHIVIYVSKHSKYSCLLYNKFKSGTLMTNAIIDAHPTPRFSLSLFLFLFRSFDFFESKSVFQIFKFFVMNLRSNKTYF